MDESRSKFQLGEEKTEPEPNEKWPKYNKDLLEPQFYPDPMLFRHSLQNLTRDDIELMQNLNSQKAAFRVLAPYLKIMQKKMMESVSRTGINTGPKKVKITHALSEKKTADQTLDSAPDIADKSELILSIHETADVFKSLVGAKTAVSYLVNPSRNEITQIPRHVESSTSNLTWKIEEGTTMAAFCAFKKEHVVSNNIGSDPRFPLGLGFPGTLLKYALCVPIKTPDHQVVAVYELSRDAFGLAFDKSDIQLVIAVTTWMGVAILQNNLYTKVTRQREWTDYLVQLTNFYHAGNATFNKTLSELAVFARESIQAERCSLFIVNTKKHNSVILEEFEQGADSFRSLYKRRTKKHVGNDGSLLSKVMLKKEIVKSHMEALDVRHSIEGIPDAGLHIRSTLCVPILSNKEAIGALQLMNKKTSTHFNQDDVDTLNLFATFCAININYLNLHENLKKCELNGHVTQEMLFHHINPCVHDEEQGRNYNRRNELPQDFFSFAWYPAPDEMPRLVEYTITMFHEVLGDSFMTLNNVPKFVLTVKNCYRPNPYHNFLHAFIVTHAMANFISRYKKVFTGLERKALMVAALCHDVDHRGYNNNFIQLTQHYLSKLYDSSPLENHHFAVTKLLLNQCKMFTYFKPAIYNELVTEIYEDIVATDLSIYFQSRMELIKTADEKTFTFVNPDHRRLVKNLMMTACDLSGLTKPLPICQKITEDVYEELFLQGDIEKKMGFNPLPTMDREKKDMMAENQVQFLTVVVLPCMETVCRIFGGLSPIVWDTKNLVKQWQDLVELKEKDTWKPEDSLSFSTSKSA